MRDVNSSFQFSVFSFQKFENNAVFHNCAGDNCSVCGFIYACGNILRIFGGAVIGSLPVLPALFTRIGFNGAAVNTHRTFSLFAQKEMLLN